MTVMLVYCDDPSHTADPVGPIITDPDPQASCPTMCFIVADPFFYNSLVDSWQKRCLWCGQRSGRWKTADLAALITRLTAEGATGVSLRTLDRIKHTTT